MNIKQGDILISRDMHSCVVKFVEGSDESGILLVDGIKDEFYEAEQFGLMHEKYELLVRKEDRLDTFNF